MDYPKLQKKRIGFSSLSILPHSHTLIFFVTLSDFINVGFHFIEWIPDLLLLEPKTLEFIQICLFCENICTYFVIIPVLHTQQTFTCSNLTTKTLETDVKHVES